MYPGNATGTSCGVADGATISPLSGRSGLKSSLVNSKCRRFRRSCRPSVVTSSDLGCPEGLRTYALFAHAPLERRRTVAPVSSGASSLPGRLVWERFTMECSGPVSMSGRVLRSLLPCNISAGVMPHSSGVVLILLMTWTPFSAKPFDCGYPGLDVMCLKSYALEKDLNS
ncbi:uncharacterized protein LOC142776307 [Rhipicephalus microplus]|uniref:uncharacterized protein LOC142776307 n=1 Tax=Rhipicephalus microplus TaxID=6941 RepID=UPI003F6C19D3